jgi:hypothetical protein
MANLRNLTIDQGSTYSISIELSDANDNPLDLSDYTIHAQLRKSYGSTTYTAFTTSSGEDPEDGVITLSLTAQQTGALRSGRYVYDVEIVDGSEVIRVLEGIITITPEVTR